MPNYRIIATVKDTFKPAYSRLALAKEIKRCLERELGLTIIDFSLGRRQLMKKPVLPAENKK